MKSRIGGKSRGKGDFNVGGVAPWRKGSKTTSTDSSVDADALMAARFHDPDEDDGRAGVKGSSSGASRGEGYSSGNASRQTRVPALPPPPPPTTSPADLMPPKEPANTPSSLDTGSKSNTTKEKQISDKATTAQVQEDRRVKDEIFEELVRLLDTCTALRLSDFDFRVRQHLHALYGSGGRPRLEEALSTIRTATNKKLRDAVKNWPAYLLTLLKKFDCVLATRAREERAQLRKAKAASEKVNVDGEQSVAVDEDDSWSRALAEAWEEETTAANHTAVAQPEPSLESSLKPAPLPDSATSVSVKALVPPTPPPSAPPMLASPPPAAPPMPPTSPPTASPVVQFPSGARTAPTTQSPIMAALATAPYARTERETLAPPQSVVEPCSAIVAMLKAQAQHQRNVEAGARGCNSMASVLGPRPSTDLQFRQARLLEAAAVLGRGSDGGSTSTRQSFHLSAHVPPLQPPFASQCSYGQSLMPAEASLRHSYFMAPRPPPGNWHATEDKTDDVDAGPRCADGLPATRSRPKNWRQARPNAASDPHLPKNSAGRESRRAAAKFDFDAWAAQVQGAVRQPIAAR